MADQRLRVVQLHSKMSPRWRSLFIVKTCAHMSISWSRCLDQGVLMIETEPWWFQGCSKPFPTKSFIHHLLRYLSASKNGEYCLNRAESAQESVKSLHWRPSIRGDSLHFESKRDRIIACQFGIANRRLQAELHGTFERIPIWRFNALPCIANLGCNLALWESLLWTSFPDRETFILIESTISGADLRKLRKKGSWPTFKGNMLQDPSGRKRLFSRWLDHRTQIYGLTRFSCMTEVCHFKSLQPIQLDCVGSIRRASKVSAVGKSSIHNERSNDLGLPQHWTECMLLSADSFVFEFPKRLSSSWNGDWRWVCSLRLLGYDSYRSSLEGFRHYVVILGSWVGFDLFVTIFWWGHLPGVGFVDFVDEVSPSIIPQVVSSQTIPCGQRLLLLLIGLHMSLESYMWCINDGQ